MFQCHQQDSSCPHQIQYNYTLPHALSLTYTMLITPPEGYQPLSLLGWERELNRTFSDNQRHHILRFTHKSSICTKIQETNHKLLTRWYRTPVLLHKFFPATSDICWRCGEERGTLLHIFWSCPKMVDFWKTVCLYVVLHKSSQNALCRKTPWVFYYMHPQLQSASTPFRHKCS